MNHRPALLLTLTAIAGFSGVPALADWYPVAPPYQLVSLRHADFLQEVVEFTTFVSPEHAIGDNYSQHPGAFTIGMPPPGEYFVGLLSRPIDTLHPSETVFAWETGFESSGAGPEITLGHWDGTQFFAAGNSLAAIYDYTGRNLDAPFDSFAVNSSSLLVSLFGVSGLTDLNAIRITTTFLGHNQITAVAVGAVPLPGNLTLLGIGLVSFSGIAWMRRRKAAAA